MTWFFQSPTCSLSLPLFLQGGRKLKSINQGHVQWFSGIVFPHLLAVPRVVCEWTKVPSVRRLCTFQGRGGPALDTHLSSTTCGLRWMAGSLLVWTSRAPGKHCLAVPLTPRLTHHPLPRWVRQSSQAQRGLWGAGGKRGTQTLLHFPSQPSFLKILAQGTEHGSLPQETHQETSRGSSDSVFQTLRTSTLSSGRILRLFFSSQFMFVPVFFFF